MNDISAPDTPTELDVLLNGNKGVTTKTLEPWLWEAACSIRGAMDAPKYRDYILPLVFLKRLSDVYDDEVAALAERLGGEDRARAMIAADRNLVRGLWVDVIADLRTHTRAVAIKAGKGDVAGAWDLAASAAEGGPGHGWRRTSRRVGGGTATVWKRDLYRAFAARDTAVEVVRAARSIGRLSRNRVPPPGTA